MEPCSTEVEGLRYQHWLWVLKVRERGVHELQRWDSPQRCGSWTFFLSLHLDHGSHLTGSSPWHMSFLLAQGPWDSSSMPRVAVALGCLHTCSSLVPGPSAEMPPLSSISCFLAQLHTQHLTELGKLLEPFLAPKFTDTQPTEWLFLYHNLTRLQGTQPSVYFCEGISKRP